ncbi:MAG: hypothetical protein IPK26_11550 [Planctomycetes bacterium]|nr:hypothetical protein [Planctomycetota bacterium]
MEIVLGDRRRVWLGRISRPDEFVCPVRREYALLLFAGDEPWSPAAQAELADRLVGSGCRYAVCAGTGSSSWDDAIDMASVMASVEGRPAPLVMTTWHDEPLTEVVDFFAANTRFENWRTDEYMVLLVGANDGDERRLRELVHRRFDPMPS